MARQLQEAELLPCHYASADQPTLRDRSWTEQQWKAARLKVGTQGAVLIQDEVQKIPDWSESVKHLWDEDIRHQPGEGWSNLPLGRIWSIPQGAAKWRFFTGGTATKRWTSCSNRGID